MVNWKENRIITSNRFLNNAVVREDFAQSVNNTAVLTIYARLKTVMVNTLRKGFPEMTSRKSKKRHPDMCENQVRTQPQECIGLS